MFLNRLQFLEFAQKYALSQSQIEAIAQDLNIELNEENEQDETVVINEGDGQMQSNEIMELTVSNRYTLHDLIGVGGMGEVYRGWDGTMRRFVALKVLHSKKVNEQKAQDRFLQEARLSGRIQHGNITPIYDIGKLEDQRLFYAMPEIIGRSLSDVLKTGQWPIRRLIHVILQVVEAICVSHDQHIAHLDLKPSNIMISENGSVYLVDWGLAQHLNSTGTVQGTQHNIEGTPAYMAPEQALGHFENVGIRSDIYAIGSILYEILSGQAPYQGSDPKVVIEKVIQTPPIPLRTLTQSFSNQTDLPERTSLKRNKECPEELIELCERSMVREVKERTLTIRDVRKELQAWLDGVKQKEKAEAAVSIAKIHIAEAKSLHFEKKRLYDQIIHKELSVKKNDQLEDHMSLWELKQNHDKVKQKLAMTQEEIRQQLHTALHFHPNFNKARLTLLDHLIDTLDIAEAGQDRPQTELLQYRIQSLLKELPEDHTQVIQARARLNHIESISITTDPAGSEVRVFKYTEKDYRLQEGDCVHILKTPIHELSLSHGSYRLHISHPDCEPTKHPITIKHSKTSEDCTFHVSLLKKGTLRPQTHYVPAGWFIFGSGDHKINSPKVERCWQEGFIAMRFPVNQSELLFFLNDLIAEGKDEKVESIVPRHHLHLEGRTPPPIYKKNADGFYTLFDEPDADGDILESDFPALAMNVEGIQNYAEWRSRKDKLHPNFGWRLPTHHEWERMARGADDRRYPWGYHYAPQWSHTNDSHEKRTLRPATDFPIDESPYGIRALSGCIREFTSTYREKDGYYVIKGGSWFDPSRYADVTSLNYFQSNKMHGNLGFRFVRSIPPSEFWKSN
ncbi:MAG: protein kinase domain-containing protein [Myxococcota bacterium]